MSTNPNLDNFDLNPETNRILGVALEKTRVTLGLADHLADGNHREAHHRTCQGRRAEFRSFV